MGRVWTYRVLVAHVSVTVGKPSQANQSDITYTSTQDKPQGRIAIK
jgi:hypothetical protein